MRFTMTGGVPPDGHVSAENVGLEFPGGHVALRDISFSAAAGEFLAIIGPSGCGKSTLLRIVAGLISPTMGSISVGAAAGKRSRQRIGFVFQDPRLLPWRTAVQNISLPLELERIPAGSRTGSVRDALSLVGLTATDGEKTPAMLSGGMRMRVSLARALITAPEVLLLDEPFAALDDVLRQQLNDELLRIWESRRPTTLFVTHNVAEAVYLSQRVLVFSSFPGRIVCDRRIPFGYPRQPELKETGEFARVSGELSRALRAAA